MPPPSDTRYVELRLRRPDAWSVLRLVMLAGVAGLAVLLLRRPALGLDVFWNLVVPALPLVFVLAPTVWRNVCPMASANQTPRFLGLTRARRLPPWLERHGYGIGITLFLCAVAMRPVLLERSGIAVVLLLGAALVVPFLTGFVFAGKSGFCGSICPLRPSQDVLSRAPAVRVAHAHCKPCVGCSSTCADVKPATQLVESLHAADPAHRAYRRIFAGALPAVTFALFTAPSAMGLAGHGARLAVAGLAGVGLLFVLEALAPARPGQLTALFGAVSFGLFYWFNVPLMSGTIGALAGVDVPQLVLDEARALLILGAVGWLVRAWRESGRRERDMAEVLTLGATAPAPAREVGPAVTVPMDPHPAQARARARRGTAAAGRAHVVRVGEPPVEIPDRRGPGRPMRPPTVTFWPQGEQIEVPVGTTLARAVRLAGIDLPEGCGGGMCGSDPVLVLTGGDRLSPAGDDERGTLGRLGLPEGTRLACSAQVLGDVAIDLDARAGERGAASVPAARQAPAVAGPQAVEHVVVLGNGVAGITAAGHVRRLSPEARIDVVSESPRPFYNRIAIARLIHEPTPPDLQLLSDRWYDAQRIRQWLNAAVERIDAQARHVVLASGEVLPYDKLIVATGARARIPPIPGMDLPGVFGVRTADDARAIRAYVEEHRCRRAVVVGGGLLGVEVADALVKLGVRCVVVERSEWLSNAEIDRRAGTMLRDELARRGVEVLLGSAVTRVRGTDGPEAVDLAGGRHVGADIVLVCTGITPNAELARAAGLECRLGLVVDEQMRTSDPDVLACGDVTELTGALAGRWPVAVEQAEVAAVTALGGHRPYGAGPVPTKLKVSDLTLNVAGAKQAGPGDEEWVDEDAATGTYRKLIVSGGRVVGALVYGDGSDWDALVAAVRERRPAREVLDGLGGGAWAPRVARAA